jgi:hypothetical protein
MGAFATTGQLGVAQVAVEVFVVGHPALAVADTGGHVDHVLQDPVGRVAGHIDGNGEDDGRITWRI